MIQTRGIKTAFEAGFELCSLLQVVNLGQVFPSHLPRAFLSSKSIWLQMPPIWPQVHQQLWLWPIYPATWSPVRVQSLPGSETLKWHLAWFPEVSHVLSALWSFSSCRDHPRGSSYENSRFVPISKDTSLPPVMGLAGLAAIGKLCFICEHPSCFSR